MVIISQNSYATKSNKNSSYWDFIKGKTPPNTFFYEMFTLHVVPSSLKIRNWHTQLLAIQYKGIFAGTFINSFYNRSYALGIGRQLYEKEYNNIYSRAGYRMGIIYGYTKDQAPLSNISPVIPLVQPYINFSYKNTLGIELSIAADPSLSLFFYF